jgi:hypothetical protein
MAERLLRLGPDRHVWLRCQRADPFGGMKRRGLGVAVERGSMGTTYGDPRSNQKLEIEVLLGRWQLSVSASWKGKPYGT